MDTRKFITLWVAFLGIIMLLAWTPWLTKYKAISAVETRFAQNWQNVADGCGFNCQGCGVTSARRVLFGTVVEIEYACGLLPEDTPEYHQRTSVFVSCFSTVHNLPEP